MASQATKRRAKGRDQGGGVDAAFSALVAVLKPDPVPANAFTCEMVQAATGKSQASVYRRLSQLLKDGTLARGGNRRQFYWFNDPARTAAGLRRLETRMRKERRSSP
jgi:hypothetical protein